MPSLLQMSYVSCTQNLCQHLPSRWMPPSFLWLIGNCYLLPRFNPSFPSALITRGLGGREGAFQVCINLVLTFLSELHHRGKTACRGSSSYRRPMLRKGEQDVNHFGIHTVQFFFSSLLLMCSSSSFFFLFLFFSDSILPEYFLQRRRLELFKAAVPSVSSPSYFKINHSPGGNE